MTDEAKIVVNSHEQRGADPLQLAVVPDLMQVLGFLPPETRYPSVQEYVHRDPTYLELVQDTVPWNGADGVDVQITTICKAQWD